MARILRANGQAQARRGFAENRPTNQNPPKLRSIHKNHRPRRRLQRLVERSPAARGSIYRQAIPIAMWLFYFHGHTIPVSVYLPFQQKEVYYDRTQKTHAARHAAARLLSTHAGDVPARRPPTRRAFPQAPRSNHRRRTA